MATGSTTNTPGQGSRRILIIGEMQRVFVDADYLDERVFDVCPEVVDGIHAAASGAYDAIGVVVSGRAFKLRKMLNAIRDQTNAKLLLLADICEEPIARRFIDEQAAGRSVPFIDDYVICPTRSISLFKWAQIPDRPYLEKSDRLPVEDELERRTRVLEKLATEDDLTGLKNRRYIWEFARQILDHARREGGRVTLLVYDIDDFKHYNDVYGHTIGDVILKEAAVLMRSCCRAHDVVGRIGGDEFAVIFWDDPGEKSQENTTERRSSHMAHPKEAIFVAQRFRTALENSDLDLLGPDGKGVLTISGGLASYPVDSDSAEGLFEKADAALLEAKRSGKNRVYLVGGPNDDIAGYHADTSQ